MKLAIIGCGPRGLSALESLYAKAAQEDKLISIHTTIFEQTEQLGNGPIYHLEQPDTNWMNVSERGLTIPERKSVDSKNFKIPGFPSYQEWCGYNKDKSKEGATDYFPFRSQVGSYLQQRFASIAEVLVDNGLLEIIEEKVITVDYNHEGFTLKTFNDETHLADEILLTIGHQPTVLDKQIQMWSLAVRNLNELHLFNNPYPVNAVRNIVSKEQTVALRGFGLAMIDMARALTQGLGGTFHIKNKTTRKMVYTPSTKKPVKLIPFSLDGLPMTPKPLNYNIDKWFIPTEDELDEFAKHLEDAIKESRNLANGLFVIEAITPIIVRKFLALGNNALQHSHSDVELKTITKDWLETGNDDKDLIISKELNAYESLKGYVDMATGKAKISLDYLAGQVWRHCQPTMYKELSFTPLDEDVIAALVQRDERLKRYSYGPPVDSMQQLLALVDEGTMSLEFVRNPDIKVTEKGWSFDNDKTVVLAEIMIDSVLDSPKLLKVNSQLVNSLLNDSLIEPLHSSLGIETYKNALVVLDDEKEQVPLAVLGRLAKGTIIGVDAILECFSVRSDLWADGCVARVSKSH